MRSPADRTRHPTSRLLRTACEARKFVARNLVYLRSLRYRLQGYEAIGDPLRVYSVPVDSIDQYVLPWKADDLDDHVPAFAIEGGDWDRRREPFEDHPIHEMMRERFVENRRWEETQRYRAVERKLERGGMTGNLDVPASEQSIAKYREYLSYLDRLYESIRTDGYRRQDELGPADDFAARCLPAAVNEVQVLIGRDGTVLHCYGFHRVSIAKLLGLDTIPVRTRVRHAGWQEVRERVADSTSLRDLELDLDSGTVRSHPELADLLDGEERSRTRLTPF